MSRTMPDGRYPAPRATLLDRALRHLAIPVAITATAAQPLLRGLPRGHDTLLHLYRIPLISALWREGILYSRWMPGLVAGYGYPLLNFYPHFSAYLITVLYWISGRNASRAGILGYTIIIALAALGMYALCRAIFGPRGAAIGAAVYVLSPTFLYQLYARGSISNALAMSMYPVAAWLLFRVATRPSGARVVLAAASLATLLLSHAAASLVMAPPLVALSLAACMGWDTSRKARWTRSGLVAATLALGLALGAFYWAPAMLEAGETHYADALSSPDVHYSLHFGSVLALAPWPIVGETNAPLPITVGPVQLALGVLGTALAAVTARRWRGIPERARANTLTIISGTLGLTYLFLASSASEPIWRASALLQNLQFPWRLDDAAVFLLSLSAARVLGSWHDRRHELIVGSLVVLALALTALPYMYPAIESGVPEQPTLADVTTYERESGAIGLTSWGEYLPATVPWPLPNDILASDAEEESLGEKVILPEDATLLSTSGGLLWAQLEYEAPTDSAIMFKVFWFDGWRAYIDGAEIGSAPDDEGLLTIALPAGRHTLRVAWGATPLRLSASVVSLTALVGCLLLLLVRSGLLLQRRLSVIAAAPTVPDKVSPRQLGRVVLYGLLVFAVTKVLVLDRVDTPLVQHPQAGCPRGTTCLGTEFTGGVVLASFEFEGNDSVVLYWTDEDTPDADYGVEVRITDMLGATVQTLTSLHPGGMPSSRWSAGDLVYDRYTWEAPIESLPTAYRVRVSLVDPTTQEDVLLASAEGQATQVDLGVVRYPEPNTATPDDERSLDVVFGDAIRLAGVTYPRRLAQGDPGELTLRWIAEQPVSDAYTVFVHVLDGAGDLVAGDDGQPVGGLYPTSLWASGEVVLDRRSFSPDVPAGVYTVQVGLYLLSNGQRLPVSGSDTDYADSVTIGMLVISDN